MTPSIATLLGRWFWWPQRVRTRARPARCFGQNGPGRNRHVACHVSRADYLWVAVGRLTRQQSTFLGELTASRRRARRRFVTRCVPRTGKP